MKIAMITKNKSKQPNWHSPNPNEGFTIIELMIATTVFAVVLLIITFGMLQVGRTYYKGITAAKTQSAARTIIDQITQAIQFSGGTVTDTDSNTNTPGTTYALCIDTNRYSYVLDREITDNSTIGADQAHHALVVDKPSGGCDFNTPIGDLVSMSSNLGAGQTEMLGPFMRLANLSVTPDITNSDPLHPVLWRVSVTVVYGDDDLLNATHDTCLSQAGSQFCAVSQLSTEVEKRLP